MVLVVSAHGRRGAVEKKLLAFVTDQTAAVHSRAYVFDDLTAGRSRDLDLETSSGVDSSDGANDSAAVVSMIGTCNGLLCLRRKSGDIAVTNPITGETVAVDLPATWYCIDASFSFGYHPATGQYKIVHRKVSGPDAMCVLTLGQGAWRVVPIPREYSCYLLYGLVTIDGITYWTTANGERIVSFDLKDERVAPVESPPVPEPITCWRPSCELTDVGGEARPCRLVSYASDKTELWVLEGGREGERPAWVLQYTVYPHQKIAMPHVVHDGHVLTTSEAQTRRGNKLILKAHRSRSCGMVRVSVYKGWRSLRTFAYVETREPVRVYGDSPWRSRDTT